MVRKEDFNKAKMNAAGKENEGFVWNRTVIRQLLIWANFRQTVSHTFK